MEIHLFVPSPDVPLLHPADGERSLGNILCHGGTRRNRGLVSHCDRCHQFHIRSHKDPVTDNRRMLLKSIVVTGDRACADIDLFSNKRISNIG